MTFDDFAYHFMDETFCMLDRRPKTARALLAFCSMVPDEVIEELPRITIFAPDFGRFGFCAYAPKADALIYLDYSLEKHSQAEAGAIDAQSKRLVRCRNPGNQSRRGRWHCGAAHESLSLRAKSEDLLTPVICPTIPVDLRCGVYHRRVETVIVTGR
jgi:hypothetical protein